MNNRSQWDERSWTFSELKWTYTNDYEWSFTNVYEWLRMILNVHEGSCILFTTYSVPYDIEAWTWPSRPWMSSPKCLRMMINIANLIDEPYLGCFQAITRLHLDDGVLRLALLWRNHWRSLFPGFWKWHSGRGRLLGIGLYREFVIGEVVAVRLEATWVPCRSVVVSGGGDHATSWVWWGLWNRLWWLVPRLSCASCIRLPFASSLWRRWRLRLTPNLLLLRCLRQHAGDAWFCWTRTAGGLAQRLLKNAASLADSAFPLARGHFGVTFRYLKPHLLAYSWKRYDWKGDPLSVL